MLRSSKVTSYYISRLYKSHFGSAIRWLEMIGSRIREPFTKNLFFPNLPRSFPKLLDDRPSTPQIFALTMAKTRARASKDNHQSSSPTAAASQPTLPDTKRKWRGSNRDSTTPAASASVETTSTSQPSTGSRRRGLPHFVSKALAEEIEDRGGIHLFHRQGGNQPLKNICDTDTVLYGEQGSYRRRQITQKVQYWKSQDDVNFWRTVLDQYEIEPKQRVEEEQEIQQEQDVEQERDVEHEQELGVENLFASLDIDDNSSAVLPQEVEQENMSDNKHGKYPSKDFVRSR